MDSPYVFLADEGNNTIAVLNWNLNYLYSIGRKGEGPGEFIRINDIDAKDGRLVVADGGQNKIELFDYAGDYKGEFRAYSVNPPQVSLTHNGTIKFLGFRHSADKLVFEYTNEGELIGKSVIRPDIERHSRSAEAQMIVEDDQIFIAYTQLPQITGFGDYTFDWTYDYVKCFPIIKEGLEQAERVDRDPNYFTLQYYHGGLTRIDNKLIVAAIIYNLVILDLDTGLVYPISTGDLSMDFIWAGRGTFEDMKIVNNYLLLVSRLNGCLLRVPLQDIQEAIGKGMTLSPEP